MPASSPRFPSQHSFFLSPPPETGSLTPNAELAKHGIDTLAMLRDKITNGLTPDESSMLDSIIYELKMKYVSHSQK